MPEFQITAPDGRKFRVKAPEGATKEQALEKIKSQYQPSGSQKANKAPSVLQASIGPSNQSRAIMQPPAPPRGDDKSQPKEDDIFAGLSPEIAQQIKNRFPEAEKTETSRRAYRPGLSGIAETIDIGKQDTVTRNRRRAANLERIRQDNPQLAELIESVSPLESGLIGAGKQVEDIGQGLGRLVGLLDAEDVRDDPGYQALKDTRASAGIGEATAEAGMLLVPGGAASKISRIAPRVGATAGVEATAAGLDVAGEGGAPAEIATAAVASGVLGPAISEAAGPFLRTKPGRATAATEEPRQGPYRSPETGLAVEPPGGRPPEMGVDEIPVEQIDINQTSRTPPGERIPIEDIDIGDTPLPKRQEIRRAIESGDKAGAAYKINQKGNIVADPVAKRAMKQGYSDRAVATAKHMSSSDKRRAREMLRLVERALKNPSDAARNPPSRVIGDSVMDRFNVVRRENRRASTDVRRAIDNIGNERIDITDAADDFTDDLEGLGISYQYTNRGLVPDFQGSQIEGNRAVAPIRRVLNRLKNTNTAKELHDLKRYIDRQIDWDKNPAEPLDREAVNVLKKLRGSINERLRQASDEYASANDRFRETITSMNDIMDVMGRRFDPESDNVSSLVGQQMRKTLSNYGVGPDMLQAVDTLDATAAKYGGQMNDDPIHLATLYSEFERLFGSFKPQSFQGVQEKAGERVARRVLSGGASGGITEVADAALGRVFEGLRGINEENALRVMRELLRESN